jgi:thiamine biosynthesis protein ThiI
MIVIRYDEIAIKGKNRPMFERRLVDNLCRLLAIPQSRVTRERGRVYIEAEGQESEWVRRIEQVFGVKNFSPMIRVEPVMSAIEAAAVDLARQQVDRGRRSFKVETRRADKTFPLNSLEINVHLGRIVLEAVPELKVDVHTPDFILQVEVRPPGVFLSNQTFQGPGGLPVGINGRALLLLSGGIDSPVAGWMVMKRGLSVDTLYFNSPPYTGEKAKEKVFEIAQVLSQWKTAPVKVFVPYFTEIQLETGHAIPPPLWTVVHRRFMHRIAERVARKHRYHALATGESIGQVASQTVHNLECVDRAVDILTLRPLTGFDKVEIVNRAKHIGTYAISILPHEDCCALFAPKQPKTRARIREVEAFEARLDAEKLMATALERMEVFRVSPTEIVPVPPKIAGS